MFPRRFDAFSQGLKAQPFGHRQDGRDDLLLFAVFVNARDKAAVDLDPAQREAADIGDRRVTRAEIIKINAAAQRRQGRDIANHHIIVGLGDNGFQNFHRQPIWGQVEPIQFPFDLFGQLRVAKFRRREIHGNAGHRQPGLVPAHERGKCVVQHHFAKPFRQASRFDGGQEFCRGHDAPVRVVPACQGLEPADRPGIGRNLWLKMRHDLTLIQRRFQCIALGIPVGAGAGHVGGEAADRAGTVTQRLIRRNLGAFEQAAPGFFRCAGNEAEADRGGDIYLRPIKADRRADFGLDAPGHLHQRFKIDAFDRAERHRKTTAFQPRDSIALPQSAANPVARPFKHIGLHGAAVAVDDAVGIVELDHKAGGGKAGGRFGAQNGVNACGDLRAKRPPAELVIGCRRGNTHAKCAGQNEKHGQAERCQDQRCLAAQPERGERQGGQEDHQFGFAELRADPDNHLCQLKRPIPHAASDPCYAALSGNACGKAKGRG